MNVLMMALGCLFAFVMLAPHADVHYEHAPAARSSR